VPLILVSRAFEEKVADCLIFHIACITFGRVSPPYPGISRYMSGTKLVEHANAMLLELCCQLLKVHWLKIRVNSS
jgi:hypothetical protein